VGLKKYLAQSASQEHIISVKKKIALIQTFVVDPAQQKYNAVPHSFRAFCGMSGRPQSIRFMPDQ
jgi:hypothetical protein